MGPKELTPRNRTYIAESLLHIGHLYSGVLQTLFNVSTLKRSFTKGLA